MSGRWAPEPPRARFEEIPGGPGHDDVRPVHFEVVVVGGGPAGAATALSLARRGRRVAVLERSSGGPIGVGETLPPEVRAPLDALGLWGRFLDGGPIASPGTVSAWGAPGLREADHILNPFGCGWQVERGPFDAMLASAAAAEGCVYLRPARVARAPRRSSSGWRIEALVGGERSLLLAGVIVDATGRSSTLARSLGARRLVDDRLIGLVTRRPALRTRSGDDRRTLVEAVEDGWWYSVPLADGGLMAAFLTDSDLVPRGRGAMADFLVARLRLAPHTADRLGGANPVARVRARSAESSRLDRASGEGWLAVGDAASAWDPLSSQGVYRALVAGLEAAGAVDGLLRGDRRALEAHAARVAVDHEDYLGMRADYYGIERRWECSPFWRRRHGPMAAGLGPDPSRGDRDGPSRRRDGAPPNGMDTPENFFGGFSLTFRERPA